MDQDSSFLDIPGPSTRRWRRPPATHSVSAPPPVTTQGKGKLRKKTSRLFTVDGRSRASPSPEMMAPQQPVLNRSTASAPDVTPDTGSVDLRTSSGVVVDPPQGSVALGTRVSNWWTSLLVPDSMGQGRRRSVRQGEQRSGEGRSQRSVVGQSTTHTFLAAAKQKAVGGVRYLLDGDALPEGTEDVWVRGVVHRFQDDGEAWPDSCESSRTAACVSLMVVRSSAGLSVDGVVYVPLTICTDTTSPNYHPLRRRVPTSSNAARRRGTSGEQDDITMDMDDQCRRTNGLDGGFRMGLYAPHGAVSVGECVGTPSSRTRCVFLPFLPSSDLC